MPSVELNVTKTYAKKFRLGPVELTLRDGVTCIVGANGAGKSTLFRVIAGFTKPDSSSNVGGIRNSRIGYLPQEMLFPGLATCAEFLNHVAWLYQVPKSHRADSVTRALESVGLKERATSKIKELSGGMKRRLGVAHAILHDPEILILDEPTAGLDPLQRKALRAVIREQSRARVTLLSTHLIDDVIDISDEVVILREGQVAFSGPQSRLLPLTPGEINSGTDVENAIVRYMSPNHS